MIKIREKMLSDKKTIKIRAKVVNGNGNLNQEVCEIAKLE
jgi:hypothetical protein